MVRMGAVIVVGAVIVSMVIAMMFFVNYQPSVIQVNLGEPIKVGPAQYTLGFEGTEKGSKELKSTETFLKIIIQTESLSEEDIQAQKRQFTLIDKLGTMTPPTHGEFAEESTSSILAYFPLVDEELDETYQYKIMIKPTKEQKSTDIGIVCITNCQ